MSDSAQPSRRDFHKLSAAAIAGILSGTMAGCGGGTASAADKHSCRGLNACKGLGKSGKNACAGQGDCATYPAHQCGGQNACKGQGGCGAEPGLNECKGKGGCSMPLHSGTWEKVRERFEKQMQTAGKKFGAAPAAPQE